MTWPTDIFCQKCNNLVKAGKKIHEVEGNHVDIRLHICDSCHKGTGEKVETSKMKKMKVKLKKRNK